jgi:hypothetical protein
MLNLDQNMTALLLFDGETGIADSKLELAHLGYPFTSDRYAYRRFYRQSRIRRRGVKDNRSIHPMVPMNFDLTRSITEVYILT